MSIVKPRTMPGVMELLPREQLQFERMLRTIRDGYRRFGFLPIETPVMELKDVLLTKSGGETEKQVYFVQSTGSLAKGEDPKLALRFDLTVPLARYVAEHENDLVFPFRRYQMQRVYRGERAQRGRFREFYQCDIDVIGRGELSLLYDAEIPAVISHVFTELDFGPFTIHMNNRKVLKGLLESLGVGDAARQTLVLREIDKLDKRGLDHVRESLVGGEIGLDGGTIDELVGLFRTSGDNDEVLARLGGVEGGTELFREGVDELRRVTQALRQLDVPEESFRLNLAIARGLDYYTGTVYETILDEHEEIGSVCSGGRYDDLAGHYTKSKLPGVGISIGATRLFYQLQEAGVLKGGDRSSIDVMVSYLDADLEADYRHIAATLRRAGFDTEMQIEKRKIGKQMQYAHRAGIPLVVTMGGDEKARGSVALKDFARNEEQQVPLADLTDEIRRRLDVGGAS